MEREAWGARVKKIQTKPPKFHGYVIFHEHGSTFGFDARPMADVEAEWLSKWSRSGARMARVDLDDKRIGAAVHREVSREFPESDDVVKPVDRPTPGSDEVLRLSGIPDLGDLGAVAIIAASIRGIAHAPPGEVGGWLRADEAEGRRRRRRRKP